VNEVDPASSGEIMITRMWRGWTAASDADSYERRADGDDVGVISPLP
jgi:hypothetical protein